MSLITNPSSEGKRGDKIEEENKSQVAQSAGAAEG